MTPPLLSIVICTFNRAESLDKVLNSLSRQKVSSLDEWTVVVINNLCTDHTTDVVTKHVKEGRIPDLQEIHEPVQGLTPARQRGVQSTRSQWVAFVDDDCIADEEWVEHTLAFAKTNSNCAAFGGKVILEWESPPPQRAQTFSYSYAEQNHGNDVVARDFLVGTGITIQRSCLEETGWATGAFIADRTGASLISGGDVELALRLAAIAPLQFTPEPTLHHQIPRSRTSLDYLKSINYELGKSQCFASAMQSQQSLPRWIITSYLRNTAAVIRRLMALVRYLPRKSTREAAQIRLSLASGAVAGIATVHALAPSRKGGILGLAVAKSP